MNRRESLPKAKKLDDLIGILRKNILNIKKNYSVKSIGVFGSYVYNEQRDKSDLDILIEFTETSSLISFIRFEHHLSDILGIKADLVMKDAIEKIENFTERMDYDHFANDDKTIFAVIRALEIIDEASKKIPNSAKITTPLMYYQYFWIVEL